MKLKLHWQILIALLLAIAVSSLVKLYEVQETIVGLKLVATCQFISKLFLNALTMVVVPLIASCIISGMMGMGSEKNFGRMGTKAITYYILSTLIAVLVGLLVVNIIQPGKIDSETARIILAQVKEPVGFQAKVQGHSILSQFANVFTQMVPSNIFSAASDNRQLLGIIFFCLLFGYFAAHLPEKQKKFQTKLWKSLQKITLNMAELVLKTAPIGIFALVTPKFIDFGFELFVPIMKFSVTTLLALGIHFFVIMSLFLWAFGINPLSHFKAMAPALLTAFSTASSIATIPIAMECLEKTAGVSNRVTSFTLPLGASINMNGTALYECIVVIFVAQFYQTLNPGFQFGFALQFIVVSLALLTSLGVAGIPSASIVAIAIILGVVGLPFEYVGIVLVVDRILDMCRTAVNIFSDTVGTVVIGKSEGEQQIYANNRESA